MVGTQNFQLYGQHLTQRARDLRKNSTLSEVLLWNQLKNRQLLDYKFRRQTPIANYIVDFYCKELQLVIEIDGLSHDFKIEYDQEREEKLQSWGARILHFSDQDVKKDIGMIVQRIADWIEANQPTPTPPKRGMP